MRTDTQTLQQKVDDLETLDMCLRLLSNAADAIVSANTVLRHAKELASAIDDPVLRRAVMKAAGKLKASAHGFYEET